MMAAPLASQLGAITCRAGCLGMIAYKHTATCVTFTLVCEVLYHAFAKSFNQL